MYARKGTLSTVQVLGAGEERLWDIMTTSYKCICVQRKLSRREEPLILSASARRKEIVYSTFTHSFLWKVRDSNCSKEEFET